MNNVCDTVNGQQFLTTRQDRLSNTQAYQDARTQAYQAGQAAQPVPPAAAPITPAGTVVGRVIQGAVASVANACNPGVGTNSRTIASCQSKCGQSDTQCSNTYYQKLNEQLAIGDCNSVASQVKDSALSMTGQGGSDCANAARTAAEQAASPAASPTNAGTPCTSSNPSDAAEGNVLSNCTIDYTPLEPLPTGLGGATGFGGNSSTFLGFVNYLFPILITLGAMMGVLFFTIWGLQYMMSSVPGVKESAKGHVWAAIEGLVLLVSSVLILTTINPTLTNFSAFEARLNSLSGMITSAQGTNSLTSGGGTSGGAQGAPAAATLPGTDGFVPPAKPLSPPANP